MNLSFNLLVLTLTGMLEHDLPTFVDDILRWPILVVVGFHVAYSLSCATGYRMPWRLMAACTASVDFSKANSGVWTPMTIRPLSL